MFRQPSECKHDGEAQAGAALISAMLAVALAASMAMVLLRQTDHWIERVAVSRDKGQALQLARVGVDFARTVLSADAQRSNVDALDEDWARVLPPLRQEGSEVSGQIEDLQGRFNLNNLRRPDGTIDEQAHTALRRLLSTLSLPEELADTLADWLDADDSPRAGGAETAGNQTHGDGASVANRPLEHLASLLRIKGYTHSAVSRLQPFVCVLPGQYAVNVNTATPEILAAVQPGLSLSGARAVVRSRQSTHFRDLADYRNRLPDRDLPSPLTPIGTASQFFLIHTEARTGLGRSRVGALVERLGDGSRSRILWMSIQ